MSGTEGFLGSFVDNRATDPQTDATYRAGKSGQSRREAPGHKGVGVGILSRPGLGLRRTAGEAVFLMLAY